MNVQLTTSCSSYVFVTALTGVRKFGRKRGSNYDLALPLLRDEIKSLFCDVRTCPDHAPNGDYTCDDCVLPPNHKEPEDNKEVL
jgi:hypothetical protein